MIEGFADTAFYAAFFNRRDQDHALAFELARSFEGRGRIVTTGFVLLELSALMAEPPGREAFLRFVDGISVRAETEVIPLGLDLYHQGLALYRARPDKGWSLTDCVSFQVMHERGIREALTSDHHFVEAGFTALLPVRR